ncbi:MAG: SxtJ family membrane protein [Alphaproteobacteria bacterium]|nr:SxtJ family membrane protein [Alphaproteobacteria bacterium]
MSDRSATHEVLQRDHEVKTSSDRAFGIVFAVVFGLIGLWPLIGEGGVRLWALIIAAAFAIAAFAMPRLLAPLNRQWTRLGLVLHKIVNPIVMGFLFYVVVTPIGLLMRVLGKNPLKLEFDRAARSYWVERRPPGPAPETMKNQF